MNEIVQIFQQLKSLTSIKDKEELLFKNKDNEILKTLLEINLNPYKLFYIRDKVQYNRVEILEPDANKTYLEFLNLTSKLTNREVTGNAAKAVVAAFMSKLDPTVAGLYETVLLKSPIGVSEKTVNKIWPGLIPSFSLMLAPNQLPVITQVKYPIFVQPKLDGYRCVYKNGDMWSRAGKPFANQNLKEYFKNVFGIQDYVLDGELYSHELKFNQLTSLLNNETASLPKGLKYFVYDAIPTIQWENQNCKMPYETRIKMVRKILNDSISDYTKVIDVSTDLVQTSKEAIDLYKKYLKSGYEGAMLKAPDGIYRWKRVTVKSGEMLKLKPYESLDLKVTGIYDGEGKYIGMAGGVVVDYNGTAVRCGTGFDDVTRKAMAEQPSKFISKIAQIRYLEVTEDGSLRHPSFERWREEKE